MSNAPFDEFGVCTISLATVRRKFTIGFFKENLRLKSYICYSSSNFAQTLTAIFQRPARSRPEFRISLPKFLRIAKSQNLIEQSTLEFFFVKFWFFSKNIGWISKFRFIRPPVVQLLVHKTVAKIGFLAKAYFSLLQNCQFLTHECRNLNIDLKFQMGSRIDWHCIYMSKVWWRCDK